MKRIPEEYHPNNAEFDRLVDGELSEAERRALLSRLDDEPGGWRRCALAFLESQCWKETLGEVWETNRAEPSESPRLASPIRPRWQKRFGTVMAMAASFLVAFWIGSAMQRSSFERSSQSPLGAAGSVASASKVSAQLDDAGRSLAFSPQSPETASPWRMVTVSEPSGGGRPEASLRLPAVERDRIDDHWLQSLPPAMPEEVRQAFSRSGHQVHQQRELVPVPLQDGRQLVVPVDRVQVNYVGNNAY